MTSNVETTPMNSVLAVPSEGMVKIEFFPPLPSWVEGGHLLGRAIDSFLLTLWLPAHTCA